ncbi:response regulator transcription factor [Saccharopolyspora sp. NPDC050642]|uniref:response regulator transcription factor n=1 Tax=Saccharopolyspora sp. NPDC050642 TaxID=3157099 RepID=UPI00340FF5E7
MAATQIAELRAENRAGGHDEHRRPERHDAVTGAQPSREQHARTGQHQADEEARLDDQHEAGPGQQSSALDARRENPALPILILSQHVEQLYARELLSDRSGGIGYLLKDRIGDVWHFVDAVRRVAEGGTAMDPEVISQLLARPRRDDPVDALTPREREVMALVAEGLSNRAISHRLHVSDKAVSKHTNNIFGKLGLPATEDHNRRVLAVLAFLQSV